MIELIKARAVCRMATAVFAILVCSHASFAETNMEQQLRVCAAERDDAVRLACFDRLAAAETNATSRPSQAADPVPEERFGIHGSPLAQRDDKDNDEPESVSAKVTRLERRRDGTLLLTLDNGQVWAEKQENPRFQIRVGESVTLKRGALHSYRLVASSGRATRVTRVQ